MPICIIYLCNYLQNSARIHFYCLNKHRINLESFTKYICVLVIAVCLLATIHVNKFWCNFVWNLGQHVCACIVQSIYLHIRVCSHTVAHSILKPPYYFFVLYLSCTPFWAIKMKHSQVIF